MCAARQDQTMHKIIREHVYYIVDACIVLVTLPVLGLHNEAMGIPGSITQHQEGHQEGDTGTIYY